MNGIFEQLAWLTKTVKKLCCIVENGGGGGGCGDCPVTTDGVTITGDGTTGNPLVAANLSSVSFQFGATFDGQGSSILLNTVTYFRMTKSGTINSWSILALGSSPTCTLDIWKIADGTVLPTVADSITPLGKPALATGNAISSTNTTGWTTTSFTAGDMFAIRVDAISNATFINFVINAQ